MTGERLKNIGLEKDVWKELKALAAERECTLSQAVDYLLERSKEQDAKQSGGPGAVGKKPRD